MGGFAYYAGDDFAGSEISGVWKVSLWDAMILAAAEEIGADVVLTEDLNHGQQIAGVRVENPF